MKTFVILAMTIAAVNCGLLKELIQPVTESVHKGELFNQKEQKEGGKETQGVLDKLVNNLDAGAEKLIDVLTGKTPGGLDAINKKTNETASEKTDASKVGDGNKDSEVKEVKDTTVPVVDKDKETKVDVPTTPKIGEPTTVKVDEVTTPKVSEVKPEEAKKVDEAKA